MFPYYIQKFSCLFREWRFPLSLEDIPDFSYLLASWYSLKAAQGTYICIFMIFLQILLKIKKNYWNGKNVEFSFSHPNLHKINNLCDVLVLWLSISTNLFSMCNFSKQSHKSDTSTEVTSQLNQWGNLSMNFHTWFYFPSIIKIVA